MEDTEFVNGLVLDKEKAHIAMPTQVKDARIALINSALEFKGKTIDAKININAPDQLKAFLKEEKGACQAILQKVKSSGANALFVEKGIDNYCIHLLAQEGIFAVRRVRRSDMEKIARATGASLVNNVDELIQDNLGYAGFLEERDVTGKMMIYVKECREPKASSILIRGGTLHIVDEVERAIDDCLGTVPAAMIDRKLLVGGGASELELAKQLRNFATRISGTERLAVEAFANALEIIPKALAENAGFNLLDIFVEMRSYNEKYGNRMGFDTSSGKVKDLYEEGIIEPLRIKTQAVSLASEVASMILRINDIIAAKKMSLPTPEDRMKNSNIDRASNN